MTKYELDIPDPSRHSLDELPKYLQDELRTALFKINEATLTEVILGSQIHQLVLTDSFNSAGPNNKNIIPSVTRPLPTGYSKTTQVVMLNFAIERGGKPVKGNAIGKVPGGSDVLFDRAVEDIIELANASLSEIGIATIPQRLIR